MLHPYRDASRTQIPLPIEGILETPGRELFIMLCEVNQWLGEPPVLQSGLQGTRIYAIYRDSAFVIEDFWNQFGITMARIGTAWQTSVFGTARNQETVCLTTEQNGKLVDLLEQSSSGKAGDELETLCIQVDCGNETTAHKMLQLLLAVDWRTNLAAMNWNELGFIQEQGLYLDLYPEGLFCYAGMEKSDEPYGAYQDCLVSLSFAQKTTLWMTFLRDGMQPVEFEWLADAIANDAIPNRLEWELALEEAMSRLRYRMVNRNHTFEMFDGEGGRIYFGVDGRHTAEKVLLKVVFPLNY